MVITVVPGVYTEPGFRFSSITVTGCRFENNVAAVPTNATVAIIAICAGTHANYRIAANRFGGNNVDAINSRDVTRTNLTLANNMFVLKDGRRALDLYGVTKANTAIRFLFNSMLFTHGSSAAIHGATVGAGLEVRNNAACGLNGSPYLVSGTKVALAGYSRVGGL